MKLLVLQNQIKHETSRAALIKLPGTKNKAFWVSKRLLSAYKSSYALYAGDDYSFTVTGGEREYTIGAAELAEYFKEIESPYETHKPKQLDIERKEIPEDLLDE